MDTLQHQTYKDEIHSLQEEIRLLEQQSQNSHIYMGSFLKTMDIQQEKFSVQNSESWKCSNTDLEAQIEQAESQIALLTQLTGIGFTKCIMTTMGKGDDKRKQYRLSGYSHSLQFDLEFELMDVQTEENVITTVTELNVILESNEFCDLSRFISRTEEKKSLLLLFRTLSTFAKWYELRQVTFRHFKEKYPKVIRLPEGSNSEYMVLECSKVPGIELKIFWKIFVSEEGVVVPVLDLLTKVPAEALGLDTKKVVDNAPNSFRKLIRVFGIEAAIDHLIKLM